MEEEEVSSGGWAVELPHGQRRIPFFRWAVSKKVPKKGRF